MAVIVSPSLLSGNFANMEADLRMIEKSEADFVHIDVMDGHFVPNLTFGPPVIKAFRKHSTKVFDVHLMVSNPDQYLNIYKEAGADFLTVHIEAVNHLNRSIQAIHSLGIKAGVAINPHTSTSTLENIIEYCDLVLIMSVNPGFGGQSFISNSLRKIEEVARFKEKYNKDLIIEVDGGVNLQNAREIISAGANALVAGNAVFSSPNPIETIKELKNIEK